MHTMVPDYMVQGTSSRPQNYINGYAPPGLRIHSVGVETRVEV